MRALRARYGLTLKEMAERTGIPFSTLSKVEHDRLTLTYDKLQMISEKLNIRMAELFAEPDDQGAAIANSRRSVGRLADAIAITTPNYDYFYLSPELRQKDMIPIWTRVKARSLAEFGPLVRHEGQEFLYVLQGSIDVHTEFYGPVTLAAGESVYIDSRMAHGYTASAGCEEALVICVCSSTQEELINQATQAAGEPHSQAASTVPRGNAFSRSGTQSRRPAAHGARGARA